MEGLQKVDPNGRISFKTLIELKIKIKTRNKFLLEINFRNILFSSFGPRDPKTIPETI